MSLETSLATVRRFQSETEAIREVPEPLAVRMTIFVLAAFLVVGLFLTLVTKLDRVVTSQGGKIVPVGQDSLDWKRIFSTAKAAGVKNYFVEMDLPLMKASVPYLRQLQVT